MPDPRPLLTDELRALAEKWRDESEQRAVEPWEYSTAPHRPGAYDAGKRWGQHLAYQHAAELAAPLEAELERLRPLRDTGLTWVGAKRVVANLTTDERAHTRLALVRAWDTAETVHEAAILAAVDAEGEGSAG